MSSEGETELISRIIKEESEEMRHKIIEKSPRGRFSRFNKELENTQGRQVYKAIDNDTGCEVAWNVLKTSNMKKSERDCFQQEIMSMKKLNHPNLVNLTNVWFNREKEETVFITEILIGASLKQYLNRLTPNLRVIKHWCRGILKGLEYLHSQIPSPIIHRNLKCENIFINSSTGEIRIGELGTSTFNKNSSKRSLANNIQLIAPELFEDKYGPGVDIYSFGLCMLEMCTHSTPYSECKTPIETYNRIITGKLPQSLDQILNNEAKDFIKLCLGPESERPTAKALLNSSFLIIDDEDNEVHLPIKLKSKKEFPAVECKEPQTPTIKLISNKKDIHDMEVELNMQLKLGFRGPWSKAVKATRLDFVYNITKDTPETISEELIKAFLLHPSYSKTISQLVKQKLLEIMREQDTNNEAEKEKSTFCRRVNRLKTPPVRFLGRAK